MIGHMLEAISEWEGHKTKIVCLLCGGRLETISGEFSIEAGDRIGEKEVVRCLVNPDHEFDFDDYERLKAQSQGYSATTVHSTKLCA